MGNKRIIDALNSQLQKEFYSQYLYIAMEAYCSDQNLDGFANFFHVQAQEEQSHAYKIFNFIGRIGGSVELEALAKPKNDFESPLEVFELSLTHEKGITKSIHNLMDIALEEKNHTTTAFLQWFITEQAEEEESVEKTVKKLRLMNNNPAGLLMIDQELSQRVFTPIPLDA